jgi:two-component system sensor histidine kinase BaeS
VHLRLAPTDVDELVATVVASRQGRARVAGVSLEVVGAAGVHPAVDGRRLRQVVANLLDNALGHTDAGDRVSVTAARVGEVLELTVADTGTGIPPEHLPRLFDRFYRADPSRPRAGGGTGLGLAISREIVAAHGGDITVSSEVGEGTTFVVRLPCPAPSTRAARGGDAAPADFTYIDLG